MRVAAAVSGGMDSLLALVSLLDAGHDVLAVHGLFLDSSPEQLLTVSGLERACQILGVEFHALDLRREFRSAVINPFRDAYSKGDTPNPCAACNPRIKFGVLLDQCKSLGAERIATGHYFRIGEVPKFGSMPIQGDDLAKDQSYFLSLVPRERLLTSIFPLAGQFKKDTLAALRERGLEPPIPTESQDVCFVPDDDYQSYLEAGGNMPPGGDVILQDGTIVGLHDGLWRYTQGQRRGLGIAWSEPLYVLDKDIHNNRLVVGPAKELPSRGCVVGQINLFADPSLWPEVVTIRTRYRQQGKPGRWEIADGHMVLSFDEPHARPTPGQVAALYAPGGVLLAGGIIESAL